MVGVEVREGEVREKSCIMLKLSVGVIKLGLGWGKGNTFGVWISPDQ